MDIVVQPEDNNIANVELQNIIDDQQNTIDTQQSTIDTPKEQVSPKDVSRAALQKQLAELNH